MSTTSEVIREDSVSRNTQNKGVFVVGNIEIDGINELITIGLSSDSTRVYIDKSGNRFRVPQASSDPTTAMNGDIFYNTSTEKFRKYQNGSWSDLDT